jgi:molybdopterin converting factor small subunit
VRQDGAVVTVRFFASARSAAGTGEVVSAATTLAGLVEELAITRDAPLARILQVASFLVDGTVCRRPDAALPDGCTVDVLPPFAGG